MFPVLDELLLEEAVSEPETTTGIPSVVEANGLTSALPPLACAKSNIKDEAPSWIPMLASKSPEFMLEPALTAKIHSALEDEKSIDPPLQVSQLLHRTFAVMMPSLTPEPSRTSMFVDVSYNGIS